MIATNKQGLGELARLGLVVGGAWLALRLWRTMRSYDLRGRNVLITGGSRGLGLVLAREFLRQGARVTICARDLVELHHAFDDLAPRDDVLALPCDVTARDEVYHLVRQVREYYGAINVLS